MNRTPPAAALRELRREVGFGCPVPDCGNPYLHWHHFDPPWRQRQHHDPAGMIALCDEHHAKADAGAFTKQQLRDFKRRGGPRAEAVRGRFDWMRRDILAVLGGNFYYENTIIFEFRGQPVIWFNRDEDGYQLLNIRMLTTSDEPRMQIQDNFWLSRGNPEDLESPPSGKLLNAMYSNGDALRIEFFELDSAAVAGTRYPGAQPEGWGISFPITAVEVHVRVGGTDIGFGPRETAILGLRMRNCFFARNRVGLALG